ncbi:His-Xaa-Ser system radical SAM maturase HxsB [Candidatus Woesearchaeota archaeon]|nr:His-Xaa-Ser system radical SAM maturase HxsB [Candidatus Woesearchaeota archaeon]
MAISYFNETAVFGKENVVNNYRVKKIKGKFLVSTDQGSWAVLEKKEYDQLMNNKLDDSLFKTLEEKGVIITKNNLNLIIDDYKKRYRYLSNGTSLHIMIPTSRCNHKCVYCHSAAKNESAYDCDMNEETAKKTLNFIFQTPAKSITIEFQGGDTLLNIKIFKFIVKEAKEMNKIFNKKIRFALVTNLTLMTDRLMEWIIKEKVSISTSLDGPKIVHDKNRIFEGGKPTYDKVTYWIKRIKEKYNYPLGALMVTTRYSLPYYKEIIDEYVKWDFTNLQIKYINKLGFAENTWKEIGYTIEEFIDFWEKSVDYMIELNKKGIKIKSRYVGLILQKILTKYDPSFLDFRNPCGIVCGQMAYNYNGDIYCCDEGRMNEIFKLGNTKKNNYSKILSSEQSQQLISASINDNYVCDNCAYKAWCGLCPVIAYAEQGNIVPKISTFSKCKLHKSQFDYIFKKLLFNERVKNVFFSWLNDLGGNTKESWDLSSLIKKKYGIIINSIKIKKNLNDVGIIINKKSKWVLKIYRNKFENKTKNKRSLASINKYLLFLHNKGLKVCVPCKNKKSQYESNLKDNFFSIYHYIEGSEFKKKDSEIKSSAKNLALFHNLSKEYQKKIYTRNFLDLKKIICASKNKIFLRINSNEEKSFITMNILKLINLTKKNNYNKLNKLYTHGDFRWNNLIYKNGKLSAILDFDSVTYGPKIFDVAIILSSLIHYYGQDILIEKIKIFYDEYIKQSKINKYEKKKIINLMVIHCLDQILSAIKRTEEYRVKNIILKLNWIRKNEKKLKSIL